MILKNKKRNAKIKEKEKDATKNSQLSKKHGRSR
jgi:hypothetical protein